MKITEKDIDEFLEFRRRFTDLEWTTMNNYVEVVLNNRKRNFVLTDSEVEEIRKLIKNSRLLLMENLAKAMGLDD